MLKPVPTVPKRLGNSPATKPQQHFPKAKPSLDKEEMRSHIKLNSLMSHIEEIKNDKEELFGVIALINSTRKATLVIPQLLTHLGISIKSNPNDFTTKELLKIVLFLYEAVVARDKPFIGSESYELWYDPTLHVLHYTNLNSPVKAGDGVRPNYCHTLSKGFNSKEEAEAMVSFLYSPEAMAEYGIKAIGYRTDGKHTRCPIEIKVWLSSNRWQQQNNLINLLAEEEGKEG